MFGKIGEQLFERNRWVPNDRGRWDYLNLKDGVLPPNLTATFLPGLCLHV
jgi:hypothetical protein